MKKNVIIIATITFVVLCVVCLTACTYYATPYNMSEVLYQRHGEGDFIKTDVKLSDLSDEYKAKLLAFDHIKEENWFSDTVLRYIVHLDEDMSQDDQYDKEFFDLLSKSASEPQKKEKLSLLSYISLRPEYELGRAYDYSEADPTSVTLFDEARKLKKGEMVLSKWEYFAVYVDAYDIKLSLSDIERIIDGKDCFAKYWILRNCGNIRDGLYNKAIDVACLCYYGLIPADLKEKISVNVSIAFAKEGKETFKVVGYYENGYETDVMELLDKDMDRATARTLGNVKSKREEEPYKSYIATIEKAFADNSPVYFRETIVKQG